MTTIMPTSASAKTRLKPWSGSIDPKFLLFGRGPDFNATGNGHGAEPGWSGSPARRSTSHAEALVEVAEAAKLDAFKEVMGGGGSVRIQLKIESKIRESHSKIKY